MKMTRVEGVTRLRALFKMAATGHNKKLYIYLFVQKSQLIPLFRLI